MLASLILSSVLASSASTELAISNLRSGLACIRSAPVKGRSGWICQPTELILVTDQGTCVYDKNTEPCTWHGFEFDYVASTPNLKLECVLRSSEPTDVGGPEGLAEVKVESSRFDLTLPEQKGHFFNPQYYLFALRSEERGDLLEETTCSHAGVIAFTVKFRFHFPTAPKEG
jgi:hypothetical protein